MYTYTGSGGPLFGKSAVVYNDNSETLIYSQTVTGPTLYERVIPDDCRIVGYYGYDEGNDIFRLGFILAKYAYV